MRISTSAGRSKNKVYRQGSIPPNDVSGYVQAYARDGRCGSSRRRKIVAPCLIVEDMEFNAKRFKDKLPIRLLAVVGEHSIPARIVPRYSEHLTNTAPLRDGFKSYSSSSSAFASFRSRVSNPSVNQP